MKTAMKHEAERFLAARNDLVFTQAGEQAQIKAVWKARNEERRKEFALAPEPRKSHIPEEVKPFTMDDIKKRARSSVPANDNVRSRDDSDRER